MTDTATLQARLSEAETALHALMTGTKAVNVDYDGRRVTFQMTSRATLEAYVDRLKRELGETPRRRRAPGVRFA